VNIVEFLLDRITEDEAVARGALDRVTRSWGGWEEFADFGVSAESSAHVLRHHPERVLAECEAKRRIVELHAGAHECSVYAKGEVDNCAWVESDDTCSTLRLLALPYADHPDYDEAWRP